MPSGRSGPAYQYWDRVQWALFPACFLLVLVLGIWGFEDYARIHDEATTLISSLYASIQLFVLHSPHLTAPIPMPLEIARLLAVLTVGYGAILTFTAGLTRLYRVARLLDLDGHVVVCGLSQKALLLIQEFRPSRREAGRPRAAGRPPERLPVVVIEQNPDHELAPAAHKAGATILYGDATDEKLLKAARVHSCRYLIAVTQSDATNAEVLVRASRRIAADGGRLDAGDIDCFLHVSDPEMRDLFRHHAGALRLWGGRMRVRVIGIDPFESSARLALERHPLDYAPITSPADPRRVHLVVVHYGQMGESLLEQAAKIAHFANGLPPRATIFHERDSRRPPRAALLAKHRLFDKACDVAFAELAARDLTLAGRLAALCAEPAELVSVAFCNPSDSWNLAQALRLRWKLGEAPNPILVRMTSRRGFTSLLEGAGGPSPLAADLRPFGMVEDVFRREVLLDETQDALAKQIHRDFVKASGEPAAGAGPDGALLPWEELAEVYRDSNRQQADHIPVKLRALGLRCAPADASRTAVAALSEAQVEILAPMEHARWCAERHLAGWAYAPGAKDEAARTSPCLVPWEALPAGQQDKDRAAVRRIPACLESAGLFIYPA